ncbi:MAG TPA: hypothetical protein VFH39_02120 [Candidatus Saccharimonadales bacterium]|nr:hypothetical protein [Candidatus Saccharimonadales bacterium]
MPEENQIHNNEDYGDCDIGEEPFLELVPEKQDIHRNNNGHQECDERERHQATAHRDLFTMPVASGL